MSAAGALHSDHLNFLIYRYLQEFGHERTAKAFHRDWHRPVEHDDPESFPFAHTVQRNDLVSVIQDGLHYDELVSRLRKCDRRFSWTGIDARESVENGVDSGENGIAGGGGGGIGGGGGSGAAISVGTMLGLRPPSRTKRTKSSRVALRIRPTEEFGAVPAMTAATAAGGVAAQKRQRRSEGSDGQVNGNGNVDHDAMDVDAASASADADEGDEMVSPAAVSEAEGAENMVRYDSMEIGTQTDALVKTSAMCWSLEPGVAEIVQCVWNPSVHAHKPRTLLVIGKSLCRFYNVPEADSGIAQEITHIDASLSSPDSIITDVAWRPDGSVAGCAIDTAQELPDGTSLLTQVLAEYTADQGSVMLQPGKSILEPPGVVLRVRYSPNGAYVLWMRNNGKRGSVQIWKAQKIGEGVDSSLEEPLAESVCKSAVQDACWISDDAFVVCGSEGYASKYTVTRRQNDPPENSGESEGGIIEYTVLEETENLVQASPPRDFQELYFDPQLNLVAFYAPDPSGQYAEVVIHAVDESSSLNAQISLSGPTTAFALQARQRPNQKITELNDTISSTHIAVAKTDGSCLLYAITQSPDKHFDCQEIMPISLIAGPAIALSWSPSGDYLAVSSNELAQIWHVQSFRRKNGTLDTAEPILTWRRPVASHELYKEESGHDDDASNPVPCLSWSADGQSLSFAVDRQISVLSFRPPLHGTHSADITMDGGPGP